MLTDVFLSIQILIKLVEENFSIQILIKIVENIHSNNCPPDASQEFIKGFV